MIYMVEHTFSMPELEAEWNAWYEGNLHVLLGVPGIHTAQRFRVPGTQPPEFMAMYTVDGPDVFESAAYLAAGGGGTNSQRFRPAYQRWVRNVFDIDRAPAVDAGNCLVAVDAAEPGAGPDGVALAWGRAIALHKTTVWRGLGVADAAQARALAGRPGVTIFEPHGAPLVAGARA